MNNDALCFGGTDLDNADKSSQIVGELFWSNFPYGWNRGSLLLRQSDIAFYLSTSTE